MKIQTWILTLITVLILTDQGTAQNSVIVRSRLDYYTSEAEGEILVYIPETFYEEGLSFSAAYGFRYLVRGFPLQAELNIVPFDLSLIPVGRHRMSCRIFGKDSALDLAEVEIVKRDHKANEVKIDRAVGSLIVEGRPFLPFGFYCYSPVQETLAEEEVVNGFNLISPYQNIDRRGRRDRRRYMDRCAQLGMKVHYNLLSVAGGGGVNSHQNENSEAAFQKMLLTEEILAFRDHPALLAWYISDEPTGSGTSPRDIFETYRLIKRLDPYHPVSIVFMKPDRAGEYSGVMDVVMADPYPVPNRAITEVSRITAGLRRAFFLQKPVWIVPQAFGGNEWWPREPTRREIRVMTYLALINGASGIQYFIRHGRNAFPKSTEAWAETGALAREALEVHPFLFSPEAAPFLHGSPGFVQLKAASLNGDIFIMAANPRNEPELLKIEGFAFKGRKEVSVLFENREVAVRNGRLEDMIDALGTRAYLLRGEGRNAAVPPGQDGTGSSVGSGLPVEVKNYILNPGFEDNPSTGTPSGCYIRLGKDRGATFFVDSGVSYKGSHSLRLNTPREGEGVEISFFPVTLPRGRSYSVSIWARAQSKSVMENRRPRPGMFRRLFPFLFPIPSPPRFRLALGGALSKEFLLSSTWRRFSATVFIAAGREGTVRINPILTLISAGTAWFDDLVVADESIRGEGTDPSGPER